MKIILTILTAAAVCVEAIELGPLLKLLQSSSVTNAGPTVQLVPPFPELAQNQQHVQLYSVPIDGDIILLTHNAIDNEHSGNSNSNFGGYTQTKQTAPSQQQEHSNVLSSQTKESFQNTVQYDIVPSNSFSFTYTDRARPRSLIDRTSELNDDGDQSTTLQQQNTLTSTNIDPVDNTHQMKYVVEMTKSDTYSYSLPVQIVDSQGEPAAAPIAHREAVNKEPAETEDESLVRVQDTQASEQLQQVVAEDRVTVPTDGNDAQANTGTAFPAQYTLTSESFGALPNQQVVVPVEYVPVAGPQFIQETQYVPVSELQNVVQHQVATVPIQYVPVPVPVPVDELIARQSAQSLYGLYGSTIPVTVNEAIQYVPVPQYTQDAFGTAYDSATPVQYTQDSTILTQGTADPTLGLTSQDQYIQYAGLPASQAHIDENYLTAVNQGARFVTHQHIPLLVNYYVPSNSLQSTVQYAPSSGIQQSENIPQITPPTVDDVHVNPAPGASSLLSQSQDDATVHRDHFNDSENLVLQVGSVQQQQPDVVVTATPPSATLVSVTSTEKSLVEIDAQEIGNAPRQPKTDEPYPGLEHAKRVLSALSEA